MEAHPRSRGENGVSIASEPDHAGSSPLTRGKHPARILRVIAPRLIPAHAGKTVRTSLSSRPSWAHPRSRGENAIPQRGGGTLRGSSPLTRGKPKALRGDAHHDGLIPAHAGKTARPASRLIPGEAHPRSRGENKQAASDIVGAVGSSPLTRGKPGPRDRPPGRFRLIPAHAGKTL